MLNFDSILASELPQARYLVLELAGLLDRVQEAAQREGRTLSSDPRLDALAQALTVLQTQFDEPDRAERILRLQSVDDTSTAL